MILLNPGPVTLSDRVRRALLSEDLCHREPEFAALTLDLRQRIESVYADGASSHAAVLLTGSGSAAVEAMLSTFAPHDSRTLVVSNGVYGERMAQMLAQQRKPLTEVRQPWESAIDLRGVQAALDSHTDVTHLAVIHHETTTGRLNDLDGLAALCAERGIGLLVDAVSSFGAEEIAFGRWAPVAVAATGNKCLHGIPGVSFVLGRRELLDEPRGHATTLYLDLERYYAVQKEGWSPFTQSVQGFFALQEALREYAEAGGWTARRATYAARSDAVGDRLARAGVRPLLPTGESASMLRTYLLPEGRDYAGLHDGLKALGFTIYAGQGRLARSVFRIATMGAIGVDDQSRLLAALSHAFTAQHA